jgi:asparagine synthase (glutamine-hydrolysing)
MILELSELLSRAVEENLEDKVAIAFSAGLDSTVIAAIAKKHSSVELFTAGVDGSEDLKCAEKIASEMKLPLTKVSIDERIAVEAYENCYKMLKLDFLRLEILVPIYCVAEAAAKKGHKVMLFGAAAEELFVGYRRYFDYKKEGKDLERILREEYKTLPQREIAWIKKICKKFGLEARCPLYNKELAELVFSIPLEEKMHDCELKKCILREAAEMLGVPDFVVKRKKRAMQYGSGVHKLLVKYGKELEKKCPPE